LAQRSDDLPRIAPIPETVANQTCLKGDKTALFPPGIPPDADCCRFGDDADGPDGETCGFSALAVANTGKLRFPPFPKLQQPVIERGRMAAEFTMFSDGSAIGRPQSRLFSLPGNPNLELNKEGLVRDGGVTVGAVVGMVWRRKAYE
jgi:hypothetical protein